MVCTKTQLDNSITLAIKGDLLIPDVAALREDVLPCLIEKDVVSLDLRNLGDVDTAAVQLLLSVSRSSTRSGSRIELKHVPQTVFSTAERMGLDLTEISECGSGGGQCPK